MTSLRDRYEAVVVGGGFYGTLVGIYLARQRGFKNILLVERESSLLSRASYNNQARVHNGYHYPRSFTTAYRSRINMPRFANDWPEAIKKDFTKIYAIASRNSKVTAKQFEKFCREIGAVLRPAEASIRKLFDPRLTEEVFIAEEYAFDSTYLARWAANELDFCQIEVLLDTKVCDLNRVGNGLELSLFQCGQLRKSVATRYVFNCTYSGINQLKGDFPGTQSELRHELAEMALVKLPDSLKNFGITVMDGPFFSIMPFPSRNMHTVSHVRYTPHLSWKDAPDNDPYLKMAAYEGTSRFDRMVRDVSRFIPSIADSKYVESLFEVKTILVKNEGDDGRPILFEKHSKLPGCYSVLGGKLDNIYDVFQKFDQEIFVL